MVITQQRAAQPLRLRGRLRLTAWSFVLLLLSISSIVLFCFSVTFAAIMVVTVGIPLTLITQRMVRWVADAQRLWAGHQLGIVIARNYRPAPEGGLIAKVKGYLRDPATWRDNAWLVVNMTVGFAIQILTISLFLGAIGHAVALPIVVAALDSAGVPIHAQFWPLPFVIIRDVPTALASGIPNGLIYFGVWWILTPYLMRGHALLSRVLLGASERARLANRVRQLSESRAETVDTQAAELRRIERDLHDGAQARLVALGMNLGMAEQLVAKNPEAAQELLMEARESTTKALSELRDLVRGIHPPVLADRGLDGAVRALALAIPLPVDVSIELPGRPPAPVESAAYFAVAEALTNVAKHSGASSAWIRVAYADGALSLMVGDNGRGGAVASAGSGLYGIERRLSAFDGTMMVASPGGGPTIITMQVPCELSAAGSPAS